MYAPPFQPMMLRVSNHLARLLSRLSTKSPSRSTARALVKPQMALTPISVVAQARLSRKARMMTQSRVNTKKCSYPFWVLIFRRVPRSISAIRLTLADFFGTSAPSEVWDVPHRHELQEPGRPQGSPLPYEETSCKARV